MYKLLLCIHMYIMCIIYYIQYTIHCMFYIVCTYITYDITDTIYYIVYSIFDTRYEIRVTIWCILYTLHSIHFDITLNVFQYSVLFAICGSSGRNWGVGGRGKARWTQASYGQPTASHECEQYQPPENQKKQNLVKWVTRHVLHSCSDLSCFGFLGFLYGFVLLWGSPFGLFGFCCFLDGFHAFSLCSSML